ncbi:MAG: hypothetical protein ACK4N5_02115 [Myxococcales bacterium]
MHTARLSAGLFTAALLLGAPASAQLKVEQGGGPLDDAFILGVGPGEHVKLISGIGGIKVLRGEQEEPNATVTVNGVPLKKSMVGGYVVDKYDKSPIPGIGAGRTLKVVVKSGADTLTFDVPCPGDLKVTSPAEGTTVSANQTVPVSWTPTLQKDGMSAPKLGALLFDTKMMQERPAGGFPTDITGKQSGEVKIPTGLNATMAPVVRFYVPGQAKSGLRCSLVKRVGLKAASK